MKGSLKVKYSLEFEYIPILMVVQYQVLTQLQLPGQVKAKIDWKLGRKKLINGSQWMKFVMNR